MCSCCLSCFLLSFLPVVDGDIPQISNELTKKYCHGSARQRTMHELKSVSKVKYTRHNLHGASHHRQPSSVAHKLCHANKVTVTYMIKHGEETLYMKDREGGANPYFLLYVSVNVREGTDQISGMRKGGTGRGKE